MIMILTSVTMVGWADVPDTDWGDFRRRRAVDISSFENRAHFDWKTIFSCFRFPIINIRQWSWDCLIFVLWVPILVGLCLHFLIHDDVIKSTLLTFCVGNHWSPVDYPHKGQWCGALTFSLICTWTNSSANNGNTGDLRRHHAHYDVIVMYFSIVTQSQWKFHLNLIKFYWSVLCILHIRQLGMVCTEICDDLIVRNGML